MVIKMPSVHHYHDTTRVKCMHAYASSSFSHRFIFTLKSFLLLTSSIIDWFYRKRNAPDKSPMRVSISITWGENFFAKDRQASNKMKSSLPFPIEIKDQFNPLSPSKIIRYSIDLSLSVSRSLLKKKIRENLLLWQRENPKGRSSSLEWSNVYLHRSMFSEIE